MLNTGLKKEIPLSSVQLGLDAIIITTTSNAINARDYNAIVVKFITNQASNWTIKLQGCFTVDGTYVDLYELANTGTQTLMSYQMNANRMFLFKGLPNFVKIIATEDAGTAIVSVSAQLINVYELIMEKERFNIEKENMIGQTNKLLFDILEELKLLNNPIKDEIPVKKEIKKEFKPNKKR